MRPKTDEKAEDFIRRLRAQAAYCGFENPDIEIRDQYIDHCPAMELGQKLVSKLIERGRELTLETVIAKARVFEQMQSQTGKEDTADLAAKVNRIQLRRNIKDRNEKGYKRGQHRKNNRERQSGSKCYACGRIGHFMRDDACPAKYVTCKQCGHVGHFDSKCKSSAETKEKYQKKTQKKKSYRKPDKGKRSVRQLGGDSEDDSADYDEMQGASQKRRYSFFVCATRVKDSDLYPVQIGNVDVKALIDSGASCNDICKRDWDRSSQTKGSTNKISQ